MKAGPKLLATACLMSVLPVVVRPVLACVYVSGYEADDPFPADAQTAYEAANCGDRLSLKSLLSAQPVLLSSTAVSGETLLQRALALGDKKVFRNLLKAGADPAQRGLDNWNVIHDAARARDPYWLKTLLAAGADPNGTATALDDLPPIGKSFPIGIALMSNHDRHFALLLEAGADPNLTDGMGNTVLHLAAQINKPWHVLALLEAGADPNARNAQGQTFQRYLWITKEQLLNERTRKGRKAVVEFLQQNGIPVQLSDGAQ